MMFRYSFVAPPEKEWEEYALGKVAQTIISRFVKAETISEAISATYVDENLLTNEFLCASGNAMYTLSLVCYRYMMVIDPALPLRISHLEVIASGDRDALESIEWLCKAIQEHLMRIGETQRKP